MAILKNFLISPPSGVINLCNLSSLCHLALFLINKLYVLGQDTALMSICFKVLLYR
ncbi:unnamed protein product [Gulo gulo]|uniref:Uncharacterized protein n=1 Tax=Gulo gulo TaxID=48420 RepID=A0A9X9LWG3_GULGU|nr:unnamed protein product [Gulo gulo]